MPGSANHYPSYKKFFSDIDGKCALVFWHTSPSPQLLEDMTAEELAKVLRKASHNTCSTKKAEEIMALVNLRLSALPGFLGSKLCALVETW